MTSLKRARSHHSTAANWDMSGGNNWQQIACLGALLAELIPIL